MSENARPLQTLIWYPSLKSTGKPMTVGNYTQLADTEIHFNVPDGKENRWRSLLKTSFGFPLWAVPEARPANGHYPILIYAPAILPFRGRTPICASILPVMATSFWQTRL
jgi:hypothetical protein